MTYIQFQISLIIGLKKKKKMVTTQKLVLQ
jgi:hypothetical protein